MADEEDKKTENAEDAAGLVPAGEGALSASSESSDDDAPPTNLGATKYVHSAFFVVGIVAAFLSGHVLAAIWNALAAWPPAVRAVPALLRYGEDDRPAFTLPAGAVIGIIVVLQLFRRPEIRQWSDDVALELSKVVWPTRETVTNGTIVVIVASAIAAIYIGLLDRLWGFMTILVYGA